jgi:hypothetical protein
MSRTAFIYAAHVGYNTLFGSSMETRPPMGAWGPTVDVFTLSGRHYQISDIASQGTSHWRFCIEWWALLDLQHCLPGG